MCEGGMCLQCTEIWGTAVDGQYYLCISRFKGIQVQCPMLCNANIDLLIIQMSYCTQNLPCQTIFGSTLTNLIMPLMDMLLIGYVC